MIIAIFGVCWVARLGETFISKRHLDEFVFIIDIYAHDRESTELELENGQTAYLYGNIETLRIEGCTQGEKITC